MGNMLNINQFENQGLLNLEFNFFSFSVNSFVSKCTRIYDFFLNVLKDPNRRKAIPNGQIDKNFQVPIGRILSSLERDSKKKKKKSELN